MISKIVNDLMYRKKFRTGRDQSDAFVLYLTKPCDWIYSAVSKVILENKH
jgi:hypothetical protein